MRTSKTLAAAPQAPSNLVDAERLAKARAARIDSIPADERAIMGQIEALNAQIAAAKDANEKAALAARRQPLEKQRKGMAFVRKFADAMLEAAALAKRIDALAGPSYFATPAQRAKAKQVLMAELVPALNKFDTNTEIAAGATDNKERKAAARMAATRLLG